MSIDLSIIGIVFAIILFIIFFAAIVLYISFRIKETFREEKKRGMLVVKVAFLIGILFLAGGSFYFFAQIIEHPSEPLPEPNNSTNVTQPTSNDTQTENEKPILTMYISYPNTIRMNTEITITFSLTNPTQYTAHDTFIQTSTLFEIFQITSSTHTVTENIIEINDVPTGTTIISIKLITSNKPGDISDTIALIFNEMNQPTTQTISISVTGGPQ